MKEGVVGRLVALLVCVVGFPFHLLVCICIRLADGGAAIYRDKRVGRCEKPFPMLKYRSMKVDCKPLIHAGSKIIVETNDPRVTSLGRVLRCGIDELPQLANIVRGEMGWVGPRPLPVSVLSKYGPVIRERFKLQPGITGLAQVLHSRSCSSARALAIDIWYLRHHNLWLDLWVIAATPLFICGWKSVGQNRLYQLLQMPEFCELERQCQEELGPGVGLLTPTLAPKG
jgi:lipopolysaccharide/colanic/teichoic acid biosynthesis glycosyltransferase